MLDQTRREDLNQVSGSRRVTVGELYRTGWTRGVNTSARRCRLCESTETTSRSWRLYFSCLKEQFTQRVKFSSVLLASWSSWRLDLKQKKPKKHQMSLCSSSAERRCYLLHWHLHCSCWANSVSMQRIWSWCNINIKFTSDWTLKINSQTSSDPANSSRRRWAELRRLAAEVSSPSLTVTPRHGRDEVDGLLGFDGGLMSLWCLCVHRTDCW